MQKTGPDDIEQSNLNLSVDNNKNTKDSSSDFNENSICCIKNRTKIIDNTCNDINKNIHETDINNENKLIRILIANNSLAAIKFILSLSDRAVEFYGMVTSVDIAANYLYISYLHKYIIVKNYSINEIIRACKELRPDLVWPEWGHSAEDFRLPLYLENNNFCSWG